jgi:CBS domain-containing protein
MLTPEVVSHDLWGFFHAGHIATELKDAVTVDGDGSASAARERLVGQRFDQAPVVFRERVIGWVLTSSLHKEQPVRSVMTPLDESAILSAESSVAGALQTLGQHGFVFTAGKDGLSGFIVPSDLDRHAARSYFYLLVAGIEMLLSELIGSAIPEGALIKIMRPGVLKRYNQARSANSETNVVEYLYIRQLVDLFLTTSYTDDPRFWDEELTQHLIAVRDFRNIVMHPTCSIAATKTPSEAAGLASAAEKVAERLREIVLALRGNNLGQMRVTSTSG